MADGYLEEEVAPKHVGRRYRVRGAAQICTLEQLAGVVAELPLAANAVPGPPPGKQGVALVRFRAAITFSQQVKMDGIFRLIASHATGEAAPSVWSSVPVAALLTTTGEGRKRDWAATKFIRSITMAAARAKQASRGRGWTADQERKAKKLANDNASLCRAVLNCAASHGYFGVRGDEFRADWSPVPPDWKPFLDECAASIASHLREAGRRLDGIPASVGVLFEILAGMPADLDADSRSWGRVFDLLEQRRSEGHYSDQQASRARRAASILQELGRIPRTSLTSLSQTRGLTPRDMEKRLWTEREARAAVDHAIYDAEDEASKRTADAAWRPIKDRVPTMAQDLRLFVGWRLDPSTLSFDGATFLGDVPKLRVQERACRASSEGNVAELLYHIGGALARLGADGLDLSKADLFTFLTYAGELVGPSRECERARLAKLADGRLRVMLSAVGQLASPFASNLAFLRNKDDGLVRLVAETRARLEDSNRRQDKSNLRQRAEADRSRGDSKGATRRSAKSFLKGEDGGTAEGAVDATVSGSRDRKDAERTLSFLTPHGMEPIEWDERGAPTNHAYNSLLRHALGLAGEVGEVIDATLGKGGVARALGIGGDGVIPADAGLRYLMMRGPDWRSDPHLSGREIARALRRVVISTLGMTAVPRSDSMRRLENHEVARKGQGLVFSFPCWKYKVSDVDHAVRVHRLPPWWIPGSISDGLLVLWDQAQEELLKDQNGETRRSSAFLVPDVRAGEGVEPEVRFGQPVCKGIMMSPTDIKQELRTIMRRLASLLDKDLPGGRPEYIWRHGVATHVYHADPLGPGKARILLGHRNQAMTDRAYNGLLPTQHNVSDERQRYDERQLEAMSVSLDAQRDV